MTALGRLRPVVTVCDFCGLATCYAESNGRVRPEADVRSVWEMEQMTLTDAVAEY
jgi:hypothetical protein